MLPDREGPDGLASVRAVRIDQLGDHSMHAHGTAVLPEPTAAALSAVSCATARERWLAKCESDFARALATGNAGALPVIASAVFLPVSLRCPDCHGTCYTSYDDIIEPCQCADFTRPAYDYRRHAKGGVVASITTSPRTPAGQAEVWVPCTCGIGPVKIGPYDGPDLTQIPWVPDCTQCSDTGWTFSHHISQTEIYYLW
jgi:hypothetical protein